MLDVKLPLPFTNTPLSPHDELRSHDCYKYPKQYLGAYGIGYQVEPHREIIILLFSTALLTFWAYQLRFELIDIGLRPSDAIVAIWALGVLLLGYLQWQEARHEISMDKYYDRLEIANKKREDGGMLIYRMMHPQAKCYRAFQKKMMLVYAELDNLEYMIEKYKLGFMNPEQACRGLRTFQHRCRSEEFRQMVKIRVLDGDYSVDTAQVVRVVIAQIEAEIEIQKAESASAPSLIPCLAAPACQVSRGRTASIAAKDQNRRQAPGDSPASRRRTIRANSSTG